MRQGGDQAVVRTKGDIAWSNWHWVKLEAKPGKEENVAAFLRSGLAIVEDEPATTTWYAIRFGPSTFGIFDTFPDESGRQAHFAGEVAKALMAEAPQWLAKPPEIEKGEILAAKTR